jgi:transposase-like protein
MSDRFDHKLEHKLESKPAEGDAGPGIVRRIELITGTGRRRRWSSDDKVRMVVESLEPGATVSEVARRHGLSPQQLFAWRREARAMSGESTEVTAAAAAPAVARPASREMTDPSRPGEPAAAFAQVVLAAPSPSSASPALKGNAPCAIEIVIGDATVRVIGQVATEAIAAALRAVRRTS